MKERRVCVKLLPILARKGEADGRDHDKVNDHDGQRDGSGRVENIIVHINGFAYFEAEEDVLSQHGEDDEQVPEGEEYPLISTYHIINEANSRTWEAI